MTDQDDLVRHLSRHAALTRYDDVTEVARLRAKQGIIDTLGVILASTGREPRIAPVLDLVTENGGRPDASVFGTDIRAPAAAAALANGTLAHALDFDSMTPWGAHADSSIVPTVLALAEKKGGITGKDLITAVAVGEDMFIRFITNVGWKMDWNLSTSVGAFSTTAAGGAVAGLNETQMLHAMGLASTHAAGIMEQIFGIGSDMRGMYAGFGAQGCVNDVLLAEKGMYGPPALFDGPAGFFNVYFKGDYKRDGILDGLGQEFRGDKMLYKYWPAVGTAFTHVHAAIELIRENQIDSNDIEEIFVYVGNFHQRMCYPLDVRKRPDLLIDAKFSLPFVIGLTMAKGDLKIGDFAVETLKDPAVLAMVDKVTPVEDSAFDWTDQLPAGKVDVVLKNGRRLSRVGDDMPGTLDRPLTWDQLGQKFAQCAKAAARPLQGEAIERALRIAQSLESMDDLSDLVSVIQSGAGAIAGSKVA
ncbi:MmgE/PrpD family protein [Paracoccus versutus]|uniref:2-methylcitrate dehydratase PrpD n=1 Tax=Paracoccus versutus TaxID=34007 RepID=A0A3D9XUG9_PARVE|nr:MmgE/PrpD family protein [Paracoccus versutus]REF73278.1 2-methylcitrate dehydratase PrpD [Paracoccus versutus]WGR54696.1 MmgE/PrpD family protein [Paracoccus versutus]